MRIKDYIEKFNAAVSGERAYRYAEGISGYNRVQVSGDIDEAADYCCDVLQKAGVESRVLRVPFGKDKYFWTQKGFDGWNCKKGILKLVSPYEEELCNYSLMPTALIQRSGSAKFDRLPIVLLDKGCSSEAYTAEELKGSIVFAPDTPYSSVTWAITEKGAKGLITDYIAETFWKKRQALPDARSYFNFFWEEDEEPYFGFVITPGQGDALKELCLRMREEGQRPCCEVEIETETYPGVISLVEAAIPGETEDEILLTAHLCHAKPSANDNASGCAAGIEAMRALSALIRSGEIPRPKAGIRLLLVPEVSGTYAYLATHEDRIAHIKAGLNLDMVGRRQEGRSGMLGIWATPDALPSFVIDLMAYVRRLTDTEAPSFNIDGRVTPFHSQIMEYNGGSDHYVYCDPTVGVPCITFMQWMDKSYHTSSDVIENLDPDMLKKSACMAALWCYAAAAPDSGDLPAVFSMMRERFLETLHRTDERAEKIAIGLKDMYSYETDVFCAAAADAARFYCGEEEQIRRQQESLKRLAEIEQPVCSKETVKSSFSDYRVPKRAIRGPISFVGNFLGAEAEEKTAALSKVWPGLYGYHSVNHFILFRVNGVRTVDEIAKLVGMESRYYCPEYVSGYLDILAERGVVTF